MTTTSIDRPVAGWTADASTFGARLALIRQRMGWGNVEKAAKSCGIPVETWRSWERDNREPQRLTTIAMTIASASGCDFLWLVHGPERGGALLTREYFQPDHVIATIGTPSGGRPVNRPRRGSVGSRPVRQTRPASADGDRPWGRVSA